MKHWVWALTVWAAAVMLAPARASAVDVCAYRVAGAFGVLCPVHAGDTICLSQSAAIGDCDVPVRCFGGGRFFCSAALQPKSGPEAQCPFGSKRPPGLRCYAPSNIITKRTPTPIMTTVNVELAEFTVSPDRSSAPSGHVRFHVTNVGEDMHEFLVIRTDLAPDMLPTEDNGAYEEDGPGTELLEEIEDIPSGESRDLDIDLPAGHYVLICNMVHVEDDELEVHYQLGMRTAFTVL